jgi:hypothetical protein
VTRKGCAGVDPEAARGSGRTLRDLFLSRLDRRDNVPGTRQIQRAFVGERQLAGGAGEKSDTEPVLDAADEFGDGGRREAE